MFLVWWSPLAVASSECPSGGILLSRALSPVAAARVEAETYPHVMIPVQREPHLRSCMSRLLPLLLQEQLH